MLHDERLEEILLHLRAATHLAEKEAQQQREEAQEFRPAAQQAALEEIALTFNSLTTYLVYAGMPILPGNEIRIRMNNAIHAVMAHAL